MKENKLRILDLGWGLQDGLEGYADLVDKSSFHNSPSLSDYDAVLLDPKEISQLWEDHLSPGRDGAYSTSPKTDGGLSRGLKNLFKTRRRDVESLLFNRSGLLLVKLRRPSRKLEIVEEGGISQIHRYSWLPQEWGGELFSGNNLTRSWGKRVTLEKRDTPSAHYLESNRDHIQYEATVQPQALEVEGGSFNPIARTITGELVSFEVEIGGGKMIFLPPLAGEESKKTFELIESSLSTPPRGPLPEWTKNERYHFDGERKVKAEVESLEKKISSLKSKEEGLERDLKEYRLYRRLLFARTGIELGRVLSEVLVRSGFNVQDLSPHLDVYACRSDADCFAINFAASPDGPIGLEPYHRLVRGIDELRIYENKDPQGVLLVNGYADHEPGQREGQFDKELQQGCNLYGFTLITADELFTSVKTGKEENSSVQKKLSELFNRS